MASQLELANAALQRIGKDSINSLTESSTNAREVNKIISIVLDEVLEESNWTFATKTVSLALEEDTPTVDFTYSYALPTDYIKIIGLYNTDKYEIDKEYHQVEGMSIQTDYESPVYLKYVYRITNYAYLTPKFNEAFILKLAYRLCNKLSVDKGQQDQLLAEYMDAISTAKLSDIKKRKKISGKQDGSFITSRY